MSKKNSDKTITDVNTLDATATGRRFLFEVSLLYLLGDMLETQKVTVEEMCDYVGVDVAGALKMSLSKMAQGAKMFHHYLRLEQKDTQLSIGTCSDGCLQLMRLISDRCNNTDDLFKMYCNIKNTYRRSSGIDIALTEKQAFG